MKLVLKISVIMGKKKKVIFFCKTCVGIPWCLEIISASLKSSDLLQRNSLRIELALDIVNMLAVQRNDTLIIHLFTFTRVYIPGSVDICDFGLQEECDR